MPKGIYKRKKKLGRPKGVKNKLKGIMQHTPVWDKKVGVKYPKEDRVLLALKEAVEDIKSPNIKAKMTAWRLQTGPLFPTEPPSFISRLEDATIKYEAAINEAIQALKG